MSTDRLDLAVRLLRLWYATRERLGFPRRVPTAEFPALSHVALLAGSPWVIWSSTTTSAAPAKFYVTNATWPAHKNGA